MVLTIGSYQISVQRREFNMEALAQQEIRRVRLEQQVQAQREQTLLQFRQISGQIRLY